MSDLTVIRICNDVLLALRQLRRHRAFAIATVLIFASSLGFNSALTGLVEAVLLRRLPVSQPEQLWLLHWTALSAPHWFSYISYGPCERLIGSAGTSGCTFSYTALEHLRQKIEGQADLAEYAPPTARKLLVNGQMEDAAQVSFVGGGFFQVIGVPMARGRPVQLSDERPGAGSVAIVSYGFWQREFGGNEDIVGRRLMLDHEAVTVVGVVSSSFTGLAPTQTPDLWMPIQPGSLINRDDWTNPNRPSEWLYGIARLRPGVPIAYTEELFSTCWREALAQDPLRQVNDVGDSKIVLVGIAKGFSVLRNQFSRSLLTLEFISVSIIAIACLNLGGVFLVRNTFRQGAVAVHLAVGASIMDVARQLLFECGLIGLSGAAIGIGLGLLGSRSLASIVASAQQTNTVLPVPLGLRGIAVSIFLGVCVTLLSAILPLLAIRKSDPARLLCGQGSTGDIYGVTQGKRRIGSLIVACEIAATMPLVFCAVLLARTLATLEGAAAVIEPSHVLTFALPSRSSGISSEDLDARFREIQHRLTSIPGVVSATWSTSVPVSKVYAVITVPSPSHDGLQFHAVQLTIGPRYFDTLQIPVISGRPIHEGDAASDGKLVWINDALARAYFGGLSAVGEHLGDWTVAGVVGDAKYGTLREPAQPTIYRPGRKGTYFAIRFAGKPQALIPVIRQSIAQIAPTLVPAAMRTEEEYIARDTLYERLLGGFSTVFAALAVIISAAGIHASLAYSIALRTREIGLRRCLGASRRRILVTTLWEGVVPVLAGLPLGVLLSLAGQHLLRNLIYGPRWVPLSAYGIGVGVIITAALSACFLPVQRAINIEIMDALRQG